MNQQQLVTELSSLGMPLAYGQFVVSPSNPAPEPPYITYHFVDNDGDVMADNINYAQIGNFQVELYTLKKDSATELLVENKFKALRIPFRKFEMWLSSEDLFQVVYLIQLIGG
jgi:hypothetical protein